MINQKKYKNKGPLLTIIVPVYNCKKYIKQTIDSIIKVTSPENTEVIFQDSKSTDGTTEVIAKATKKFPNFTHIIEKDNGQSDAINRGAKRATGEWITWLCADDLLLKDFKEVLAEIAKDNCDVVYGDCIMLQNGAIHPAIGTESYVKGKLAKKRQYIQQPGTCIRKVEWDRIIGLKLKLNWTMDYDLLLRLDGNGCRFKRLNNFVSVARIHDEAKTSSGSFKRLLEHWKILFSYQIKNPFSISCVSYAAYFIEYLIKSKESKGKNASRLHKIFWRLEEPEEISVIEKRFNTEQPLLEEYIGSFEVANG